MIRHVTSRRLAAAGARVVEAADGGEALEALPSVTPDLILLDLQMPGLDGVATIRRLRSLSPPIRCPVFVLTSHIAGPLAAEAREAGAEEIFTKPVQIQPLAAALRARRGSRGHHTPAIGGAPDGPGAPLLERASFLAAAETYPENAGMMVPEEFVGSFRADLARLAQALASGDVAAANEIAHRIRGLCLVFGARDLAGRLLRLEETLSVQAPQPAGEVLAELEAALEATRAEMQRLLRDSLA